MPEGDRKRRSGATVPESQRHTDRRVLRLTPPEAAALDSLLAASDEPASRVVGALLVAELERRGKAERRARR